MKYVVLIYSNPENWKHPMFQQEPAFLALPAEAREELVKQSEALHEELVDSGELVLGAALAAPETARTIRSSDGFPIATDGPYAEAKEQLAGYLVLECVSQARAEEIAARFPFSTTEIRPIEDFRGFGRLTDARPG